MSKARPLFALAEIERNLEKQRRRKSAKSNNREKLKFYEYVLIVGMILILYMFTAASCVVS